MKAQSRNKPRTKRYVVVLTAKQAEARNEIPTTYRNAFDKVVSLLLKNRAGKLVDDIPYLIGKMESNLKEKLRNSIENNQE